MIQLTLRLLVVWIGVLSPLAALSQGDEEGYRVKPGDVLRVSVWREEDLQGLVLVAPDGSFAFPLVGYVDARGTTVVELQQIVTERLSALISEPVVTVSLEEINGNKIYVIGQVNQPGAYVMNPAVDVMQSLAMAGGATAFASLDDIVILRRNASGQAALRFRYSAVVRGRDLEQNIQLQSGDIVVVP